MAVTHSKSAERPARLRTRAAWRGREFLGLVLASALLIIGLRAVYQVKAAALTDAEQGLSAKRLLNLNELSAREDLLPALGMISSQRDRVEMARQIYYASGNLANVGALARIRGLLTPDQFRQLKPLFVVRRPDQFRRAFWLWTLLFFAGFFAVNFWWSARGFAGDQALLPVTMLLCGAGLILMLCLRDPVRDTLLFTGTAQGVVGGCLLLAALGSLDYERLLGKLSFVPLLASFLLSFALILFGTGPGTSDAKVNLLGFQPVEIVRLLLVLFLAGYFASRWDVLRHARETRPKLAEWTGRFHVPPLEYTMPVLFSVALSLIFFFLQRDMGPALVFCCLFLTLYGLARGSGAMPAVGLALVVLGFVAGYWIGVPHTVGERVSMWLSPWDNMVHGGDQLAHSLWAYSTGGMAGMGTGHGDPQIVPAAHTDLVLSALGEEWGFVGIAAVFALYGVIIWRALRAARRARTDYELFLAGGLAAATAFQVLLIGGGSLGVTPLSGVVTPFLSYGRTAMLANFALLAMVESVSARGGEETERPAGKAIPVLATILAIGGLVAGARAAYVQVVHSDAFVGAGTLVVQADGARRYQYNPRFQDIMREIPKGTIYDRNGLPLASSDWDPLEQHRAEYQALGIDLDRACPRSESRHYPFGGLMFDLLGDLRTRQRWGASNTSFVERDQARRLRGYDDRPTLVEVKNPKTNGIDRVLRYDYRELVPLLRHRDDPQNPAVRRILDRPRDVRTSIDSRLQLKVLAILRYQLRQANRDKGAVVVMDPATGDLLASVSLPLPPDQGSETGQEGNPWLDRARYGLYPPGSTFKVVTAMAALRKNMDLAHRSYECIRLPDGRVGQFLKGSNRPIRDDVQDAAPHGTVDLERGIVVSCNAFFAQLGAYDVGAEPLWETANSMGIAAASPNTALQLKKSLPQSSYGQGQVVASPFQMARVAATVANGGAMPQGRWITDETNPRTNAPHPVLQGPAADLLGKFMREVVTAGTGRRAAASNVPIAGKTGTAELADAPSHAWFIGFAPYGSGTRKIAFAILIENGVYGGTNAAPAAAEIVNAAASLGLLQ